MNINEILSTDDIQQKKQQFSINKDGVLVYYYETEGITDVVIPNNVTSIGVNAFYSFKNLKSITIPNTVKRIGENAFLCCYCLKNVTIPDSVIIIGNGAFDYCTNLESIVIPDSVKIIGYHAFARCNNLTIHCSKGSVADRYAKNNNINIEYNDESSVKNVS